MNDFMTGYLLGRKKERRLLARATMPLQPGRPWITARGVRRLALLLVVLVVLLVALFLAFCVVVGVQHGLIYPARNQ